MNIEQFRNALINGIEERNDKGHILGDYVCHTDIPDETPLGFDAHFTACGEDETDTYLVLIQKIT